MPATIRDLVFRTRIEVTNADAATREKDKVTKATKRTVRAEKSLEDQIKQNQAALTKLGDLAARGNKKAERAIDRLIQKEKRLQTQLQKRQKLLGRGGGPGLLSTVPGKIGAAVAIPVIIEAFSAQALGEVEKLNLIRAGEGREPTFGEKAFAGGKAIPLIGSLLRSGENIFKTFRGPTAEQRQGFEIAARQKQIGLIRQRQALLETLHKKELTQIRAKIKETESLIKLERERQKTFKSEIGQLGVGEQSEVLRLIKRLQAGGDISPEDRERLSRFQFGQAILGKEGEKRFEDSVLGKRILERTPLRLAELEKRQAEQKATVLSGGIRFDKLEIRLDNLTDFANQLERELIPKILAKGRMEAAKLGRNLKTGNAGQGEFF